MNLPSTAFSLKARDFLRGLLMTVGTAVFVIIENSIQAGDFVFNWSTIWKAGLASGVIYIGKNFFTNDVPAAEKTLVEAKQKAIDKQNS